jgi:hypothetical protein
MRYRAIMSTSEGLDGLLTPIALSIVEGVRSIAARKLAYSDWFADSAKDRLNAS